MTRRIILFWTCAFLIMIIPVTGDTQPNDDGFIKPSSGIILVESVDETSTFTDLQAAIDKALDGSILSIGPGTYTATPTEFVEKLCGNCQEPVTDVTASSGFRISGKSLTLQGAGRDKTILETKAGYGVFIEDCPDIKILNLTVTGGVRDQDGAATCAGIVVRDSTVEVAYCDVRDNQGDYEKPIAGIGGIFGREGAILNIHHNRVHDNSWDGVALYRGASAQIHHNEIWNGRGAAVGITWDAWADVIGNNIHDYWKGIGSFGESRVGAYFNYVHDLRGWGIIAAGTSDMVCRNNTVVRIGNVGIAGWEETAHMDIVNNLVAFNGTVDKWVAPRVGIWMNCVEGNYRIGYNLMWENHDADVVFGYVENGDEWTYAETRNFIGLDGNLSINPLLTGDGPEVHITSPCWDSGDPQYADLDGSVSDIGCGAWMN